MAACLKRASHLKRVKFCWSCRATVRRRPSNWVNHPRLNQSLKNCFRAGRLQSVNQSISQFIYPELSRRICRLQLLKSIPVYYIHVPPTAFTFLHKLSIWPCRFDSHNKVMFRQQCLIWNYENWAIYNAEKLRIKPEVVQLAAQCLRGLLSELVSPELIGYTNPGSNPGRGNPFLMKDFLLL
jgi:hypothetical protein